MLKNMLNRKQLKKNIRYRLVYPALSLLPYDPAYALVSRLDNLMFDEIFDARNAYEAQLQLFLPKLGLDPELWSEYVRMQSGLRSRGELDAIWPYRPGRRGSDVPCVFSSESIALDLKKKGEGVIIVMAHYGRPVVLCHALASLGIQHGLLTQTFDPQLINLDRAEMTFRMRGMENLLSAIGGPWFTLQTYMHPLYKALEAGQWVIIMCDLFEPKSKSGLDIPFLDGRFQAPNGIARLAGKTGARLVYGVGKEDPAGHVHVDVRPLPDDPEAGVSAAFAELEKDVREHPWQWHHWSVMREAWRPASAVVAEAS
jgi:lauroyl/myristoyl acyltransferase